MAAKLRIGLIGTGFGTRVHMPGFLRRDDVEVTAICSANPERAAAAAERFGVPAWTADHRELVARDDVDLVDICTPPDSHRQMALDALDAGKHVLCEKPIALDAAEARDMAEAAAGRGLVHAVNHEMRYLPLFHELHRRVADGLIGTPQLVTAAVVVDHGTNPSMEPYYWGWLSEEGKGGGALMGLLSHHIDLVRSTFGDIDQVAGRVATLIPERPVLTFEYRDGDPIGPDTPTAGTRPVATDDTAAFTARLGGAALLAVTGTWSIHHPTGVRLEAFGDAGSLHLRADGTLWGAPAGRELADLTPPPDDVAPGEHRLVPSFARLVGDVAAAVADGGTGPRRFATFDDGWALQRVIDAVRDGAGVPPP